MINATPRVRFSGFTVLIALTLMVGGCGGGGTSSGGGSLSRASVSGVVENYQTAWLQFKPAAENASFAARVADWLIAPVEAGLAGVNVSLTCASSPQQSTVTGADGYFYFGGITPGDSCNLDFSYGGSTASMAVTVKSGENRYNVSIAGGRVVEVAVSSSGAIRGEIEDHHVAHNDDDYDHDSKYDDHDDHYDDHDDHDDDDHDDLSKRKKS